MKKIRTTGLLKISVIITVLLVLTLGLRWYLIKNASDTYESALKKQKERLEKIIHNEFTLVRQNLIQVANKSARLVSELKSEKITKNIFSELSEINKNNFYTIDVIDSTGNLIAWSGDAVVPSYTNYKNNKTYFEVLNQHTRYFLQYTLQEDSYHVVVYQKLWDEENNHSYFQKKIQERINAPLKFTVQPFQLQQTDYITLSDGGDNILSYLVFEPITYESYLETIESSFSPFITIFSVLLSLFVAFLIWEKSQVINDVWLKVFIQVLSLWLVRYFWVYIKFPMDLISGPLFQQTLYTSAFGWGIVASLGDYLLTVIVFLLSVLCVGKAFKEGTSLSIQSKLFSVLVIVVLPIFHIVLLRGYCASVRSMVYDSTIDFFNASSFLLSYEEIIAICTIGILTYSIVYISQILFRFYFPIFQKIRHTYTLGNYVIIVLLAVILLFVIMFFRTLVTPLLIWLMLCGYFIVNTFVKKNPKNDKPHFIITILLSMVVTIIVSVTALALYIGEKERTYYEVLLRELSQPTDSKVSQFVQNALGVTRNEFKKNQQILSEGQQPQLAYSIWKKTVAKQKIKKSAIIIYDTSGVEIDRYVVGVNSYEEREVLSELFSLEEDNIHIITSPQTQSFSNYHAMWSTIRDSLNRFYGTVAIFVSNIGVDMYGDLSSIAVRIPFSLLYLRNISVAEYKQHQLSSLSGTITGVPTNFKSLFSSEKPESHRWHRVTYGGETYEVLIMEDPQNEERKLVLFLSESNYGVLIFQLVKYISLFLGVAIIVAFVVIVKVYQWKNILMSFRLRLLVGFIILSLFPIIALATLSQKYTASLIRELITGSLTRDLEALDRRIRTYIEDEDDFVNGIDDDFCRAVASEYGIDFSVYRSMYVMASSTPEVYRSGSRSIRLNGVVYNDLESYHSTIVTEKSDNDSYYNVIGYKPIIFKGNTIGFLSVSTFEQYPLFEIDVVRKNATTISFYGVGFIIILIAVSILIMKLTKPLNVLRDATYEVAKGNLNTTVTLRVGNEFDDLIVSFNSMVGELKRSRKELERIERERAWREMAKQVAHEIRNPLTPMKLTIQHLQQLFKDKHPQREQFLVQITHSLIEHIESLARIASEFSTFAKMPVQKVEKVNVSEILQNIIGMFSSVETVQCILNKPERPVELLADKEQLQRALFNIVKNAVQALEKEGVVIVTLIEHEKEIKIIISDNGPGIPEENLGKIFEPNFSTKTEGMGLGLAISKRIIEETGGVIYCESQIGKGTTFTIVFKQ